MRAFRLLALVSLIAPLMAAILWGGLSYRRVMAEAEQSAAENATLTRKHLQRVFELQAALLEATEARATGEPPEFLTSKAFHDYLARIDRTQELALGVAIMRNDGEFVASSRTWPVKMRFEGRAYIEAIASGAEVFIDRISVQPGDVDALVLSRPFTAGGFDGVAVSAISTEAMSTFLKSLSREDGVSASFMRTDGMLLLRTDQRPAARIPPGSPIFAEMAKAERGIFQARANTDGVWRIYAFETVPGMPLVANFGIPLGNVFRNWLVDVAPVWLILALGSALLLTTTRSAQRSVAAQLRAADDRQRAEAAEKLAEQRENLMAELNHRVKNNLSLIQSMISMQLRRTGSVDGLSLQSRIQAIAEVHDLLYRTGAAQTVDLGALLVRVCRNDAINPDAERIAVDCDFDTGVEIEANRATALSLIAIELVTNAIKHAFPAGGGTVSVTLSRKECAGTLLMADNGVGYSEENTRSSGTRLIRALAEQAVARLDRVESKGGTTWALSFPLSARAGETEHGAAAS